MPSSKINRAKMLQDYYNLSVEKLTPDEELKQREAGLKLGTILPTTHYDSSFGKKEGIIPTIETPKPTETEIRSQALNRLVSGGLMQPATRDSIEGGIKKYSAPPEPSEFDRLTSGLSPEQKQQATNYKLGFSPRGKEKNINKEIDEVYKLLKTAKDDNDDEMIEHYTNRLNELKQQLIPANPLVNGYRYSGLGTFPQVPYSSGIHAMSMPKDTTQQTNKPVSTGLDTTEIIKQQLREEMKRRGINARK